MIMHGAKDEWLVVVLVLAGMLVSDVGSILFISKSSETKLVNETFLVVCRDDVTGLPVKWKGPNGVLGPKTRPVVQIASFGTSIIFNEAKNEDSGVYTCSAGDEKKEFHLTVKEPLKFTDTKTSQIGEEGKDVTLRCEVRGGKVSWSVDGGDIVDSGKYQILGDGLLIKKVHRSDSKTYICKGVQPATGMVLDRKINLRVLHKPTFPHPKYVNQDIVGGYINGTVNLTCLATADPPPTFEWLKNNDKKQKTGKIISQSPDVSVLQLFVDKHTFGNYKCIAKNTYGTLEKRFRLEEVAKPQPPKSIEVIKTGSKHVELEIVEPEVEATSLSIVQTSGFNVKYRIMEQDWKEKELNITTDNKYEVGELEPDLDYEFQVATRNPAGLSDYSNITLFHTEKSSSNTPHLTLSVLYLVISFHVHDLAFW